MRTERLWAVLSLGLAAVIASLVLLRPEEQGPQPPPSTPPPADSVEHVNAEAGYAFSYPQSWELSDEGTTSKLTSPDGTAIVSFGLGAEGTLEIASDRFVVSLEATYEDLEITGTDESLVGDHLARAVSAAATNDAGIPILIQAFTVSAPDRNYAISVFTAANLDVGALSLIREILGSFRPP